jgi:hypothetical protein
VTAQESMNNTGRRSWVTADRRLGSACGKWLCVRDRYSDLSESSSGSDGALELTGNSD